MECYLLFQDILMIYVEILLIYFYLMFGSVELYLNNCNDITLFLQLDSHLYLILHKLIYIYIKNELYIYTFIIFFRYFIQFF